MNVLVLIYGLAAVFAVLAVLIAIGVILMRVIRTQLEARSARQRDRMLRAVLVATELAEPPADALREIGDSPAVARDIFEELGEIIRGGSRERLVALGRASGLTVWLQTQLRNASPQDRRYAAEVLRMFDDERTVVALRGALDDAEPEVRLAAALALAELGHAPPVAAIVARLQSGADQPTLLLRRLFRLIVAEAPHDVIRIAEGRLGSPGLRPFAIGALASTGAHDHSTLLRVLVFDPDLEVRTAALAGLALLGQPDVADVVRDALKDAAWQVRVAAINAARRLDLGELVPDLITCLDDEVWWVSFRAAEALTALGESGLNALRAIAASETERPGRMASVVMAERGLA